MQDFIDCTAERLIAAIESKIESRKVALQFILEELDAARSGNSYVLDRINKFYFNENEYIGAMARSWPDVDGPSGPQQLLLNAICTLSQRIGVNAASMARISIAEKIAQHYRLGRYHAGQWNSPAAKALDLFAPPTCDSSLLHPHFKLLSGNEWLPVREAVSRWASGFEDRDNKFSREFQTTFNSSFWELYLFQCFKDLDLDVDFTNKSPDFYLTTKYGESFNVEAVTANHAQGATPEWLNPGKNPSPELLNTACVRILNSIDSKHKKFLKSYSRLEHVKGKPFVIALAPFEQPMSSLQNNEAIIRVLYGQGIDKDNGFVETRTPFVLKDGNVHLELGMFASSKYKEISAIIFSTTATIGKAVTQTKLPLLVRCSRYHEHHGLIIELVDNSMHFETHLDGLQVHHNPYAETKLPTTLFDRYEVSHYHYDVNSEFIDNRQRSYTLISRNIFLPASMRA